MTRVFRISGIFLILGLLVEAVSLQYNNAFSFMGSLACKYRFVVSMHGRVYLVACVPPEGSATKIEMACAQSAHLHQ